MQKAIIIANLDLFEELAEEMSSQRFQEGLLEIGVGEYTYKKIVEEGMLLEWNADFSCLGIKADDLKKIRAVQERVRIFEADVSDLIDVAIVNWDDEVDHEEMSSDMQILLRMFAAQYYATTSKGGCH